MFLKSLVNSAKRSTERLSDLSDEEVTGYLNDGVSHVEMRLGVKFAFSGVNWDDLQIINPIVDRDLAQLIVLQTKQIANATSMVDKTKVGELAVEYNLESWKRDEEYLTKLYRSFADMRGIMLPEGYAAYSMDEYMIALNPWIAINEIQRALYNNNNFYF